MWIDGWEPALFQGVFWTLTGFGVRAGQAAAGTRVRRWAIGALSVGVMLGVGAALAGLLAGGEAAPARERLVLYGLIFVVTHGAMLACWRRGRPAQSGGAS